MNHPSSLRTRWAAVGAAMAVVLGAGGVGMTHAALGSGDRSVFVPIAPCRLFDTRAGTDNVGPRTTPLGPRETYRQQVAGDNGRCTGIPADATAISMNVTAVGSTADSFLTLFPADLSTPPLASNLNWRAGAPPTPNKVDVKLSPAGAIKVYNLAGKVDVIADVVGYYRNHNHDDRYYTKAQVDSLLIPRGHGTVRVIGVIPTTIYYNMAFDGPHPGFLSARTPGGGVTCLKPDPTVLSVEDVTGGFLTDASGNDTRAYFNGTGFFGCGDDEVVVMQKINANDMATNQAFNVLVP